MSVRVTGTPGQGVVLNGLNGSAIDLGEILTINQLTDLVFKPSTNFVGNAGKFEYVVIDDGGVESSSYVGFLIEAVNDTPTFGPDAIQDNSADGQPWDIKSCASRIARLLGTDSAEAEQQQWRQLAQWFAEQQSHQITKAILQVLSAHSKLPTDAPIIGAGVGRFIVKQCAKRLNRPYQDFHDVISSSDPHASDHAPAVAVALLAKQKLP